MARVSKGKLRFLRDLYAMRRMTKLFNHSGELDLFALANRAHLFKDRPLRRKDFSFPDLKLASPEAFKRCGEMSRQIIEGVLKRQSSQSVHKSMVVVSEIDHSSSDCSNRTVILPLPENGPIDGSWDHWLDMGKTK